MNIEKIKKSASDFLTQETRKTRKQLITFGFICIIIIHTGLIPESIPSLGIKFNDSNQSKLLMIFGIINIYLLISFIIYAFSDFITLRVELINILQKKYEEKVTQNKTTDKASKIESNFIKGELSREINNFKWIKSIYTPFLFVKVLLEFLFPLLVGVYALILVF